MSFDDHDSILLERIAKALETIADPPDKSNAGLAQKLKEAEELAAARLLQLRAVKSILDPTSAGPFDQGATVMAIDQALALLNAVMP